MHAELLDPLEASLDGWLLQGVLALLFTACGRFS